MGNGRRNTKNWVPTIFTARKQAKINPGYLTLIAGDTVKFNAINTLARIFIPDADVFVGKESPLVIEVPKGGSSETFTVNKVKKSNFPYAVYCESVNDFVEVESPPEMIVEPELN